MKQIVKLLRFLSFVRRKAKSAGRVPPNAVLLPGSKSKQKCLLLAEGIFFGLVSVSSKNGREWNPARFRGPLDAAFLQQ
jgi:hypothetical protein